MDKQSCLPSKRIFYHLLALAVVAVWGVTFVCTKTLITAGMDPAAIFAIRFIMAYLGIWVLDLISSRGRVRLFSDNWKDELMCLFLGVTGGSLYFLTENTALAYTQAAVDAIDPERMFESISGDMNGTVMPSGFALRALAALSST